MIVAYVSGHGFGHATRTAEVLRAIAERDPRLPLAVVSAAPERLFRGPVPTLKAFRTAEIDVGLAQWGALAIDEAGTVERWRTFEAGWEDRLREEAAWLRQSGARLVLADVPPLAFAAAAEAGLPSVALANFSWDWIYRHLAPRQPPLMEAARRCAEAYGKADLLLELPFAGDLSAFPRRERIPLVARRPRTPREEARRQLGLDGRPAVLFSFGGLGLPGFDPVPLGALSAYRFLVQEAATALPGNVAVLPASLEGLGYQDVVAAVDVVVSKPGYGIVSDAIGARTRLVYTDRGDFPEYPILVEQMPAYLPAVHVSSDDLRAGRIGEPIREALARPFPREPRLDGAAIAADRLRQRIEG
jgi:hypothetical protein